VARGEVVRAVEDDVDVGDEVEQLLLVQLLLQCGNGDFRVERAQSGARFVDLRRADALRVVEDLALQVGEVDLVRIGEGQLAESACGQVERRGAAEAAGADDQRARPAQPLLTFYPDLGKKDVAAVAEELRVVQ
jgi:hypothetical protein